jgi:hypothetical protein
MLVVFKGFKVGLEYQLRLRPRGVVDDVVFLWELENIAEDYG